MDRWGQWLFFVSLGALGLLLARFFLTGIYKTYRFLFCYFTAVLAGGLLLAQIPFNTPAYGLAYIAIELVIDMLAVFVVMEAYKLALAGHLGLASFGRASIVIAALMALSIAAALSLVDQAVPTGQAAAFHRFLILQRSWDLVMLVFLILIGIFITWFPVEMSKNTALCIAGFSVIFFIRAGILLAANSLPRRNLPVVNGAAMIFETLIALVWAAAIRPEEARNQVTPGHFWNPGDMDRLYQQLDTINAALARFVRH